MSGRDAIRVPERVKSPHLGQEKSVASLPEGKSILLLSVNLQTGHDPDNRISYICKLELVNSI